MWRTGLVLAGIALASCARAAVPANFATEVRSVRTLPHHGTTPTYAILYTFSPPPDGNTPTGGLVLADGKLYGTTYGGGQASGECANGCGTIFSIDPYSPSHTYTRVYSFPGGSKGANPQSGLNPNGAPNELFGTTFFGGRPGRNCYIGLDCGTVFEIATTTATAEPQVIYSFRGGANAANPRGARIFVAKTLTYFGSTEYGGPKNFGTVYAVTTSGHEQLVYAFRGSSSVKGKSDGAYPSGDLASTTKCNTSCTLYGTTLMGGTHNAGTIFALTPSGGTFTESVLHSFSSAEGDVPVGVENRNGILYGAASRDGANNRGSVFAFVVASGKFSIIHSFTGSVKNHDGALPYARPIYYDDAVYGPSLYGTTQGGGKQGLGTVYRITLSDNAECVIHNFPAYTGDGLRPEATLRQFAALGDNFFGTTLQGPGSGYYNKGYGTVFEISPETACD
jgi:uncharacterized repeat protein (TIGR03803 family)